MPRAFTVEQAEERRSELKALAKQRFAERGFAGVNVEELASGVNIAKGSFYRFYDSKEALYFELLLDIQRWVRAPLIQGLDPPAPGAGDLRSALFESARRIRQEPILQSLGDARLLQRLAGKLEAGQLALNRRSDEAFLQQLILRWNQRKIAPSADQVGAHFALLILIQTNPALLGERLYGHAEATVIDSLVRCFFE